MSPGTPEAKDAGEHSLGGLAKHSAIYSLAPLLRQLIAVGMTYFFLRDDWLAKEGFGIKENVDLWLLGIQQLLGFQILSSMMRFFYERRAPADRAAVVTSCTLMVTLGAFLVCGLAFLFSERLTGTMFGATGSIRGNDLVRIVELMMLLIPFQLATLSGLFYVMTIKRSGLYTTIQTAKLLLEIALQFLFIGHLGLGVRGFLLAMLAGEAVTSACLGTWMVRTLGARIDLRVLRPILRYALPLVPMGLCQLALHNVDRRLIVELIDDKEVAFGEAGIYGLAYKLGYMATMMVLGPFLQIWQPWIFSIDDPDERAQNLGHVGTWSVLVVGATSLCVILFGHQAIGVLDPDGKFWRAYQAVPLIAGGYVFWALYNVSQVTLLSAKRTKRLFWLNAFAVLVNVTLNWILIARYGFVGAAISTALTLAVLTAAGMLATRTVSRVSYEGGKLSLILGAVVLGGGLALWIDGNELDGSLSPALAIGLKALALGGLLLGLWTTILDAGERAAVVGRLRQRLASLAT